MNKIIKWITKNIEEILIFLVVGVLFLINLYEIKNTSIPDINITKRILLYSAISVIYGVVFILLICNQKFKKINIEKIFVIIGLILGTIYLISSPLFTGSDEHNHYYRIYEITEGTFITPTKDIVGSKMPESLAKTFVAGGGANTVIKYKNILDMYKIKLDRNDKVQYGTSWTNAYENTALYSPVSYLPHVIGFLIGKLLHLTPYFIGLLGRLFNLLCYITLGYFCIKLIPKFKMFYLLILLSPNMIQCASTLSADAFTNIVFLLLLAVILKEKMSKEKLSKKNMILLTILSLTISLCKIVYIPLILLLFILPKSKFNNSLKNKIAFIGIILLVSAILNALWLNITTNVFAIAYPNSKLQKEFIFGNLFEYCVIFAKTFVNSSVNYIECLFIGTTMYHSQVKVPAIISLLYVALVGYSLYEDSYKNKLEVRDKIISAICMLAIIGLMATALYVQCTAQFVGVGNDVIAVIQGRYFIPIVFMIPMLCNFKTKKLDYSKMINLMLVFNYIALLYITRTFMI